MHAIGIRFKFFPSKTGAVSWSALMGPSKLLFLRELDLESIFKGYRDGRGLEIRKLWNGFLDLYDQYHTVTKLVRGKPRWTADEFQERALKWGQHFTRAPGNHADGTPMTDLEDIQAMYSEAHVTPYMHTLIYHFADFFRHHDYVAQFSCSAVELTNAIQQRTYRQHTSFDGGTALHQSLHDSTLQTMELTLRQLGARSETFYSRPPPIRPPIFRDMYREEYPRD